MLQWKPQKLPWVMVDALDGQVGAQFVEGLELGLDVGPELLLAFAEHERLGKAGIAGGLGRGHGMQGLDGGGGPQIGVEGEQLEEDGGAGAGRAGDDHRCGHGLLGDLGDGVDGGGEQEAGPQRAQQFLFGDEPADEVHGGGVDGGGEGFEAFLPAGVAEVAGG